MIGDLEKSSFSNIEQQSLEFVKYCLNPWIKRWEQAMWQTLILPSERTTYFIKFNLDGLLRGDYETRQKGYAIGIQNGYLCPNDVRRLENLNEIPEEKGGFNYMVNGNMVKLEDVGAAYLKNVKENEQA
jgi:HK97 family phage portal protein